MEVFGIRITLLLITTSVLGRAFDCSYIQDEDSCLSLNGCTWPTDKCEGSFLSNCEGPECYYIDPLTGSDSQNGSVSTPFNSLTSAFRKLGILSGNITILNYQPQAEAEIHDYAAINSNITVRYSTFSSEITIHDLGLYFQTTSIQSALQTSIFHLCRLTRKAH